MALANIANIPTANNAEALNDFSFSNMDHHRNVIDTIAATKGVSLNVYPLHPIPSDNWDDWHRLHQQSHNDINGVLGVQGVNLTAVDFNDAEQAASWSRLHLSEHQQWANQLGVL